MVGRLSYISTREKIKDSTGKVWSTLKAEGNFNTALFEIGDRVEGFIDEAKTEWVGGEIVGPGFNGIQDLEDLKKIFRYTRKKIVA